MNVWINGVKTGELGMWAAIAGQHGVPLGMLSGDHWAVEEAKSLLGDVEGAAVKKGLSIYSAVCINPSKTAVMIRDAARRAVLRANDFKPYRVNSPAEVKIEYTSTQHADTTEFRHGAERLDGRTVRQTADDVITALRRCGL
jgi:D-amino peptidase